MSVTIYPESPPEQRTSVMTDRPHPRVGRLTGRVFVFAAVCVPCARITDLDAIASSKDVRQLRSSESARPRRQIRKCDAQGSRWHASLRREV